MNNYNLEDFTFVEVKCTECEKEGQMLTVKAFLDADTLIAQEYRKNGFIKTKCAGCVSRGT